MLVPTFPRLVEIRAKKELDVMKLNLSVYNNSKMKRVVLTENEVNGLTAWNRLNIQVNVNRIFP